MKPLQYKINKASYPTAWEPSITNRNDKRYLKITPGTINNILPSNWQAEFILNENQVNYIKLKFFASGGGGTGFNVTGAELVVDTNASKGATPKKDVPPATAELLIAIYYRGEYKMIFDYPISVYPIIFYTTPRSNPRIGEESFDKYFIWQHA